MRPVGGRHWTWVIAGASFVGQLVVGSLGRAPSWDEAIYLSQVTLDAPALPFVPSRARGITLLVAPLASVGAPLWAVRLFLALVSSLVLALVFGLWVPSIGWGAVVGAGLFAASWPALFYGSEVMPNLWAALFAVGVAGLVVRAAARPDDQSRRAIVVLGASAALMAMMRPPDAVVVGAALTVGVLVLRSRAGKALVAMWAGIVVGVLPWVVEISVRFGGPIAAMKAAATGSHVEGVAGNLDAYAALADGPLLGPDRSTDLSLVGVAWWIGLIALAAVAAFGGVNDRSTRAARILALAGLALAAEYVFLVSGLAPRFLLAALALFSLAAGCGIETMRSRGWLRHRLALATAAASLLGLLVWQIITFDRLEAEASHERAAPQSVGQSIGERIGTSDCLVASTDDYPQVALAASCYGRSQEHLDAGALVRLRRASGDRRVVVASRNPPELRLGPEFERVPVPEPGWVAFELPSSAGRARR